MRSSRGVSCWLALCALCASLTAYATGLPRKAPEFTIEEPSGKKTPLSAYRGKVVVLEFLLTWCEHCQQEAQTITRLQKILGPKGMQPVGVAINENAAVLVAPFIKQFNIPFPVGVSTIDAASKFLGIGPTERLMAPQVVLIDRKGMIRAQTPAGGDPNFQDETKLRKMIEGLLAAR